LAIPTEDLQAIASILAAGYLRCRQRIRHEESLDNAGTSRPQGHEVDGHEKEKALETTIQEEIESLRKMTVSQLRQKHAEVFGEETRSHHKQHLFRRIAWRIQALAEGSLSERARRRAPEIANDADLRMRAPKTAFQQDVDFSPNGAVNSRLGAAFDPPTPRGRRGIRTGVQGPQHRGPGPGGRLRIRLHDL